MVSICCPCVEVGNDLRVHPHYIPGKIILCLVLLGTYVRGWCEPVGYMPIVWGWRRNINELLWSTLELQFLSVSLSVLVGLSPLFLGTIVPTAVPS